MTTYTIIGTTKGAPDNSQDRLLHLYNQTLATGARAAQGEGTGLGLVLWENAIGVINTSGFVAKIETSATAARTLTLPDTSGTVVLGDGSGITSVSAFRATLGETHALLSSDFATDLDTAQAVTGFTLALEASTTYHLRAVLRVKSASNSHAIRPALTGPAASLDFLTVIARRGNWSFPLRAFDEAANFNSMEGTDLAEIITIEGIISTNSTSPASDLGLSIKSEVLANEVTLLTGSVMTLTKVD